MTTVSGPGVATSRQVAALAAGLTAGLLGVSALPVLLEAQRTRLDATVTTMGAIATAESLAAAAGALVVTVRAGRSRPARTGRRPRPAALASWSLVAASLGYALCAATSNLLAFTAGGVLSGAATGVIFAVTGAAIATMPEPERATGRAMAWNTLPTAAVIAVAGLISDAHGAGAAYLFFGLAHLALLPLVTALPDAPAAPRLTSPAGLAGKTAEGPPAAALAGSGRVVALIAGRGRAVALIAGVVAYATVETGMYAYASDIAVHRAAMTEATAGLVLAVATIAGLGGALIAATVGTRYGSVRPVVVVLGISFLCKGLLCLMLGPLPYTVLQVIWGASYPMAQAYLIGTAGRLDGGRGAAATTTAFVVGGAVGPVQMGTVIDAGGYPLASVVIACFAMAAIPVCAWAAAGADALAESEPSR